MVRLPVKEEHGKLEVLNTGGEMNFGCRPEIELDGGFFGFAIARMAVFGRLAPIADLRVCRDIRSLRRDTEETPGLPPSTVMSRNHAGREIETQE